MLGVRSPTGARVADIFISYSHQDSARARSVRDFLRREGWSAAIDEDILVAGDEFRSRLEAAIQQAKLVIVLWSAHATSFVCDEASRAARRTVLLQLIIDDMPDSKVPLGFGELQWMRCEWQTNGELGVRSKDALRTALRRHLQGIERLGRAVEELGKEVDAKLGSDFQVLEQLGTGRMSVVFKARSALGGAVALKITPLSGILLLPGFYAEFRANVEAARELSHPNILCIRDVKLLDTIACTVMDFVDGDTLSRAIARADPHMSLGRVKDIGIDIVNALAHAHAKGVVHAGLSPSNILIEREQERVLVSDFGVPNVGAGPEATAAKALFLDARYMSPEQCVGSPATAQSDQYALGAILYEMLTGKPPFSAKAAFLLMKQHCEAEPTPIAELRPECPPEVAQTVMRLLNKQQRDRYLTTAMLANEIAAWPFAESVRACGDAARAAKSALESYHRCQRDPNFLALFYQRLREQPSLSFAFENVNFDRLVELLKPALRLLLECAQDRDDARREIQRMASGHRRFHLQEAQLRAFVDTLIELAVQRDPAVATPGQRDLLRADWREASAEGLACFIEFSHATPPRQSASVPQAGLVVDAAGTAVRSSG